MKTTLRLFYLFLLTGTLFTLNSCKRDVIYSNPKVFDNSTQVQATLLGQVIDETGNPVQGATVRSGSNVFTTEADGIFHFSRISTPQLATLVQVEKAGYHKAYRTLRVQNGQDHYTRIQLIPVSLTDQINAVTGGKVMLNGGASLQLPPNSVMYESNATPYNGQVYVYAYWMDPESLATQWQMPGDLRGVDGNQLERYLQTLGMMMVELKDNNNQTLQLVPGKEASLEFPIPGNLLTKVPQQVPMWFFNTQTGMWQEEGLAKRSGNRYTTTVKHFSFWNVDVPGNFVNLEMTLQDTTGAPLANVMVKISNPATGDVRYGWTNGSGYVNGLVPENANLNMELFVYPCMTMIHSQTLSTGTTPLNLGILNISSPMMNMAQIEGFMVNCVGNPASNGYVSVTTNGFSILVPTNASGMFNASVPLCSLPDSAEIKAYDMSTMQYSTSQFLLNAGLNNLGILSACGALSEYISWTSTVGTMNVSTTIVEPLGNFVGVFSGMPLANTYLSASDSSVTPAVFANFNFDGPASIVGAHFIQSFADQLDPNSLPSGMVPVSLTSYQAVPGWITGSFTGTFTGAIVPSRTITCTFQVRRDQ